jgi:phospholipid/cholesterol/gamma-HCH transport system ATP-binding protein
MASREPVVEVQGVAAGHGGVPVVEGVSFQVGRGEVLVIAGATGSGKSTLLKCMIGLHRPLAGRVLVEGQELAAAEGPRRRALQKRMGVLYQQGALFGSMTVLENVRLPLEELSDLPREALDRVALRKLRLVGLEGFEALLPAELSGGMRRRAALARALALDPRILFLDEPSAGLDPIASAGLDRLVLMLRRSLGLTFVVVTHELESIFAIADRVLLLDRDLRGVAASGRPAELRDHRDPRTRSFFRREAPGP